MRTLLHRLMSIVRGRRAERELDLEVDFHLSMQEQEFRLQGMAAEAARAAALRQFGGVARTKETYRERRGLPWFETTARDLRYALRGLARNRGFTAAAVLSLGLGIGANTAIFSLFHTLLLRRLPVQDPQHLVLMYRTGGWGRGYASYPLYLEIQKRTDLFDGVLVRAGVDRVRFDASGGDRLETVWREFVTGNYFALLGIRPALGRIFTDDDNRTPGAHPLAVISYDFWQRRFAGDPSIVGRTVKLDAQPLTVIGVAAPGFRGIGVDRPAELWEPAMMKGDSLMQPGANWAWIVARRKPEISRAQIQAAIDVLYERHRNSVWGSHGNAAFRKTAMSQRLEVKDAGLGISLMREQFGGALGVLMAAVVLVLLVACANVANLLLARDAAREKEIALRFSLGATRSRLVRQALAESLLLAAAGAMLVIAFAFLGQSAILRFLPATSANPFQTSPGAPLLWFSIAISLLSALLFGLAPALRSTAVDPAAHLRPGSTRARTWQPTMRRLLVVTQVAFSVVLVALAGLFSRSLSELRSVDLGFHNQSVVVFSLDFPNGWKPEARHSAYERFLDRVQHLPGVAVVSYGSPGPFRGGSASRTMRVPGSAATAEPVWINFQSIAPRFFETIGSPVLAGREFNLSDTGSTQVALVNQAFARQFLGGDANPLSRVISFDDAKPVSHIAGIVPNIPHNALREKPVPTVYVPYSKSLSDGPEILLRTNGPGNAVLPALRREVSQLGTQVTVTEPKTIRQRIDESILEDRLLATLGGFFGALALLLAAIGLYGVVAYGTVRRMGEIGIRVALGARRGAVVWMVLRDALLLVALGLAIGLPFAMAAARAVGSMLFDIRPVDPAAFLLTGAVLAAAGVAAALLPARRAATVDPARVLRHE